MRKAKVKFNVPNNKPVSKKTTKSRVDRPINRPRVDKKIVTKRTRTSRNMKNNLLMKNPRDYRKMLVL